MATIKEMFLFGPARELARARAARLGAAAAALSDLYRRPDTPPAVRAGLKRVGLDLAALADELLGEAPPEPGEGR